MRENFLNYKNYFWLWFSALVVTISSLFYIYDSPIGGRNGGTVLGYTLGVIATIGIIYLMWYGIRKRAYYAKHTTLKAVLSSHIWLGLSLLIIVPLHAGFSFGYNVHTLTYLLLVLTVLSGVWGVFMFSAYPKELYSQRGGGTTKQLTTSILHLSEDIHNLISGGEVKKSDAFVMIATRIDFPFIPSVWRSIRKERPEPLETSQTASLIERIPSAEQPDALTLVELVNKKRKLVSQLQDETRAQAFIRGWLFAHLPLSIGLCVTLLIHILSVFYYR